MYQPCTVYIHSTTPKLNYKPLKLFIMEAVRVFLIFLAVTTFIMFLASVPDALSVTIGAVFFLIIFGLGGSDDTDY